MAADKDAVTGTPSCVQLRQRSEAAGLSTENLIPEFPAIRQQLVSCLAQMIREVRSSEDSTAK